MLEVRIRAGFRTRREVELFVEQVSSELTKLKKSQRAISISDWRICPPLSDEIARLLTERLGVGHPQVQAAAVIVSKDSPSEVVKLLGAVCSSKSPGRRIFFETAELTSWAHPFLTGAEFRRLRAFIEDGGSTRLPLPRVRAGRAPRRDCG